MSIILLVSIILIASFTFFTFANINNLIEDEKKISHSQEILFTLERIKSQVNNAESSQAEYLLTSNTDFLKPYWGSYHRTKNNIDNLRFLTRENVIQQTKLDSLDNLVDNRFRQLDERLQLSNIPENFDKIQQLHSEGKKNTERIVGIIGRMVNNEEELLQYMTTKARDSAETTYTISGFFIVLTIIILITSFAFTINEFQKRNRSEAKLSDSIESLRITNENLEQFAYVASHDLQEPLRKIRAFSDLLKSDFKDKFPGEAEDYIDRMHSASIRMQAQITDLLNYSRASRDADEKETLQLRDVIKNVLSDMEISIQETEAEIDLDISSEVQILASRTQMNQLFLNLISNAIKFRKPDEKPQVIISGAHINPDEDIPGINLKKNTEYFKINVSDNGIGFDEKYLDKIFTLFQRLHPKVTYKGTGIGLAICKKIVENHDGFITASSTPGKGTTFTIIIPL